ncbi:carbohydrate-binding-like protein [Globomyces pollinis-pini]|nr:carbohydrate-binding-like protein [Globomyces pollinis-pini]
MAMQYAFNDRLFKNQLDSQISSFNSHLGSGHSSNVASIVNRIFETEYLPHYMDQQYDSSEDFLPTYSYGLINPKPKVILSGLHNSSRISSTIEESFGIINFTIVDIPTQWGESIKIAGDKKELGCWNPNAALSLNPTFCSGQLCKWEGSVRVPVGTFVEWKVIITKGKETKWATGYNQSFFVTSTHKFHGSASFH